jgi:hypothetical protein
LLFSFIENFSLIVASWKKGTEGCFFDFHCGFGPMKLLKISANMPPMFGALCGCSWK